MQTHSKGLEWEIQWIQTNVDQYDSVIQNIKKRCSLVELRKYIEELIKELEDDV